MDADQVARSNRSQLVIALDLGPASDRIVGRTAHCAHAATERAEVRQVGASKGISFANLVSRVEKEAIENPQ
jgi:hypothetical protein